MDTSVNNNPGVKTRIMLVDDHSLLRKGLAMMLDLMATVRAFNTRPDCWERVTCMQPLLPLLFSATVFCREAAEVDRPADGGVCGPFVRRCSGSGAVLVAVQRISGGLQWHAPVQTRRAAQNACDLSAVQQSARLSCRVHRLEGLLARRVREIDHVVGRTV